MGVSNVNKPKAQRSGHLFSLASPSTRPPPLLPRRLLCAPKHTHTRTSIRIELHHAFAQTNVYKTTHFYARARTLTRQAPAVAFNVDRWQIKKTY